jgi:hemin uptake protein HemP
MESRHVPVSRTDGPGTEESGVESVRQVDAQALLGARGILRIEHRGEVYTLRITRNDRLILTK